MADEEATEQVPVGEEQTEEAAAPAPEVAAPNEAADENEQPLPPPEEQGPDEAPATEEPPESAEGPEEPAPSPPRTSKTSEAKEEEQPPKQEPIKESTKEDQELQRLFDSKGSLLNTESFVKEKLADFKNKRAAIATMINDLQAKVKEYKDKDNPTDEDIANLKKYHAAFLEKLGEYEEMTRNVERLMGMADVPTSQLDMTMSGPPVKKGEKPTSLDAGKPKRPSQQLDAIEDKLPKLIVCGTDMGDSVPRIIVCEPLKKSDMEPFHKSSPTKGQTTGGGGVMNRLSECFETQQKLAAENAQMARVRHQLQEELLDKQDMLDNMRQQMMAMESEKYRLNSENAELQKRLVMTQAQRPGSPPMCKRELYTKMRGTSPDMLTGPTGCCQDNGQDLEQELEKMEGDIQSVYCELENMQRDKVALGYSTSPYSPNAKKPVCKLMLPQKSTQTDEDKEKDIFFESDKEPKYKEIREQYERLHNDFKKKVTEVAALRVELDKTKTELEDITILHHELEALHQKELDQNLILMSEQSQVQSNKERLSDFEQQANVAKQMYRSSMEEMDEMRLLIEEQATQLDEYRNKYLKTLQIAEELRKENEFKERECADQVAVEIQRVKFEMQEQLEELSPIKDLLKITQQKLRETEQMHTIALESIADLSQKLDNALTELSAAKSKIEDNETGGDITANLQYSLEEAEKKMTDLEKENARLKEVVSQLEELQSSQNQRLEEKSHELLQLVSQLETVREESARQVSRTKERSEMIRKCLQAQIAEMERETAHCRAAAAFANRERDEIRSKLQMEICLLSDNFKESQNRIMQLQQHVSYLSASHPTSFIDLVQ